MQATAEEGVPPAAAGTGAPASSGAPAAAAVSVAPGSGSPFLGRSEELAGLTKALELTGARVLVHGAHGVGRRTLIRECVRRLPWITRLP